jgi:transcription termination factor NusB
LCEESKTCKKWKKHKDFSRNRDSFVCYQKLEDNIAFIKTYGVKRFEQQQNIRQKLLKIMLKEFNEGRSKSYFCIAATIMEVEELQTAINEATDKSKRLAVKSKSKILHSILDQIAKKNNYYLKLRK